MASPLLVMKIWIFISWPSHLNSHPKDIDKHTPLKKTSRPAIIAESTATITEAKPMLEASFIGFKKG